MSDDVEAVRRKVAEKYHEVMLDLVMTGEAELKIVKDGRNATRRFFRDENKIVRWEDVDHDAASERVDADPEAGI